jgi:hypothetical protein
MKESRLFIVILLFLFSSLTVQGQASRQENYWSVGVSLNAFNYYGDLAPLPKNISSDIKFTKPNIGIEASKKLGARFSIRGAFSYGRLKGDDYESADPAKEESIGRYGRNLQFRNDIFELSAIMMYEFLPSRGRFYRRRYVSPYIFAGIAGFYHNPKGKVAEDFNGPEAGQWIALRPLNTEGQGLTRTGAGTLANDPQFGTSYAKQYSLIQATVPVGAGVKFRISDRLDLGVEIGFRILFFDHIDDVGGKHPDLRDLGSDLARAMSNRSGEPVAVISGDQRAITGNSSLGSIVNTGGINFGNGEYDIATIPGVRRLNGPGGLRGDIRGNTPADNDMYVVTGFHLNYILTTKRYPRYKRRF